MNDIDENYCYVTENGEKKVSFLGGVEFNEGRVSLIDYIKRAYYDNPDYHKYNEFNTLDRFWILFDKNLNIIEVRIMYRPHVKNQNFYYDDIFINAIKNTSGKWHKTVENKKYYVYLIQIRIY